MAGETSVSGGQEATFLHNYGKQFQNIHTEKKRASIFILFWTSTDLLHHYHLLSLPQKLKHLRRKLEHRGEGRQRGGTGKEIGLWSKRHLPSPQKINKRKGEKKYGALKSDSYVYVQRGCELDPRVNSLRDHREVQMMILYVLFHLNVLTIWNTLIEDADHEHTCLLICWVTMSNLKEITAAESTPLCLQDSDPTENKRQLVWAAYLLAWYKSK